MTSILEVESGRNEHCSSSMPVCPSFWRVVDCLETEKSKFGGGGRGSGGQNRKIWGWTAPGLVTLQLGREDHVTREGGVRWIAASGSQTGVSECSGIRQQTQAVFDAGWDHFTVMALHRQLLEPRAN